METKKICPVCKSTDIEFYEADSFTFLRCKKCSYDEGEDDGGYLGERSTQKGKSSFSPYQRGGGNRSANIGKK